MMNYLSVVGDLGNSHFRESYASSQRGIDLPIVLSLGSRTARLLAKLDTGASFCIFQRGYAEALGIDVETGQHKEIGTATVRFDVYGHAVLLSCFEWDFETFVCFAALDTFNLNVLGRIGWLDHFRLALIDHDSLLFISLFDD